MPNDYSSVTAPDVTSITAEAMAAADALVAEAIADGGRTFAGTMQPLEEAATVMADAYGRGVFLGRVHPDREVRELGVAAEEQMEKWGTDLLFRRDLFEVVTAYAAGEEANELDGPRRRLLDHWLRDLRRTGHELDADQREVLQELHRRLVELQVAFGRNLDEWQDGLDVTEADLNGLPAEYVARLGPGEAPGTFRVTMDYPDYVPFMQQARSRDLRRALQRKFWNRAAAENRGLLAEAVELRSRIARILGHASWADHAMETKMAKRPKAVAEFYASIGPGLTEMGRRELNAMQALLEADHPGDQVQVWDWSFYHDQQKRTDFGVDQNEVAAYFPLERVIDGMFELTAEVFGLEYRRIDATLAWHPDVALYEIRDRGAHRPRAYFYADLFPREGKFGHAAAFPLVYGREMPDGSYRPPVAAIVANLTKPTSDRPSLLLHGEAVTLFHEFGHILHFCLTTVPLLHFSGFQTESDFVEAPSQIMEHWMWQPAVLARFARHHETNESIPTELVERLVAARDLNVGLHTLRQVFLGQVDLMLHDERPERDLDTVLRQAHEFTLLPYPEGTFFLSSFGHLMGGYDAGYYGYLWSKVYGDDMFSVFQDEGITSPEVGARYRSEVLETGGVRDAIDHLRAFLGREPSSEAFLANIGLA
jgi:thimet oligopeptidase